MLYSIYPKVVNHQYTLGNWELMAAYLFVFGVGLDGTELQKPCQAFSHSLGGQKSGFDNTLPSTGY